MSVRTLTEKQIAFNSPSAEQIGPLPVRYGVAVNPHITMSGLISCNPAMSVRYMPSPSLGIRCPSSMSTRSNRPNSSALS